MNLKEYKTISKLSNYVSHTLTIVLVFLLVGGT